MKRGEGRLEGVIYPLPAFEVGAVKFWRAKKITHFRNFFFCLASSVGYPGLWLAGLSEGNRIR